MSHRALLLAVSLTLPLVATCDGVPPDETGAFESAQQAGPYEIDFNPKPPYLEKNTSERCVTSPLSMKTATAG